MAVAKLEDDDAAVDEVDLSELTTATASELIQAVAAVANDDVVTDEEGAAVVPLGSWAFATLTTVGAEEEQQAFVRGAVGARAAVVAVAAPVEHASVAVIGAATAEVVWPIRAAKALRIGAAGIHGIGVASTSTFENAEESAETVVMEAAG